MTTQLIAVAYVGKKPFAIDNVARSGKAWNGPGDVQEVTPAQAQALLKFPDQWALARQDDQATVDKPLQIEVSGEDGKTVQVEASELAKPLEKMSKDELKAYAKARFGKELDGRKSSKLMVDQIQEFERDLPPLTGAPTASR